MNFWRPHITPASPRLFGNDFLELLSRTHPAVVLIIYLPVSAGSLWYGLTHTNLSALTVFGLFLVGMPTWTLTEYWLHRAVMHWVPDTSWGPRMHFWVHGVHHDWPNDPLRLVMPPSISISLWFLFFGLWRLVMGRYAWPFMSGFTIGYVIYDLSHYFFHHFRPGAAWVKAWQRHHLLHHHHDKYDQRHFAISLPIWDKLFRTLGPSR